MSKRTTLALALATALSIAGATAVLAQDDAGMEPSFFTAQFGDGTGFEASELEGADPEFGSTLNITRITVDATDPRSSLLGRHGPGGLQSLLRGRRMPGRGCPGAVDATGER